VFIIQSIEVALKPGNFDGQGHVDSQRILDTFGLDVDVEHRLIYTLDLGTTIEGTKLFAQELIQPVNQRATINDSFPGDFDHVIRIGYKPGVMDPIGRSAKILASTIFGRDFSLERKVAFQELKLIKSEQPLTPVQLKKIANLFANDTIQNSQIWTAEEWTANRDHYLPTVQVPSPEPVQHYDLSQFSDTELLSLSHERSLALNLKELQTIKQYFQQPRVITARKEVGLSEKATDVELELLAQTWSEHCKHKIFNADITYVGEHGIEQRIEEGIFSRFIKQPTLTIKKQKPHFIKSVLWDNSGVVDLHPSLENYLCFKCETHNSPSNLEPYGGAITGIVGVYRDPMGTGKGSQLTFGVWSYCTGSIFYDGDLRPPLHPDQLLTGIHWGVRDGSNKHGVPAIIGTTNFDPDYMGKCLVYVGAAGLIPKSIGNQPGYEKTVNSGDHIIVGGGLVGKDGIHGATASSEEYSEHTPSGHVQIGDPYTQKNLQEFVLDCLKEDLIAFSQDSGAGGTGSAAGEMAEYSNGAIIDQEKNLYKYEGLAPWEIMTSESQEIMFFAIIPDKLKRTQELAKKWNVELRDIGEFQDTGYFHVRNQGETVNYLEMEFLHHGVPQQKLRAVWQTPAERGLTEPSLEQKLGSVDHTLLLHQMFQKENIASKEFLQREYDTRVQGRTIIPAFIGTNSDVPTDAAVQRVEFASDVGVAVGVGLKPALSKIDTYHMSQYSANEGLMRVVAVGGNPDLAANNGNYCWPGVLPDESPDHEYKLAQLVRAAMAQHDFALATGVATISGKDSMKTQGKHKDKQGQVHQIYGPPTLQFATIATVPDVKKAVTADFKQPGDLIYLVGLETKDELGGSELYAALNETGVNVPVVSSEPSMEVYRSLHQAINEESVESVKVCSTDGLAIALTQAAFAGELGAQINLDQIPHNLDPQDPHLETKLLYSGSASRFIVTIAPENQAQFENTLGQYAAAIGTVTQEKIIFHDAHKTVIQDSNLAFKESWQSTFRNKLYRGQNDS